MMAAGGDRRARVLVTKCDLCDDPIPEAPDNIEYQIDVLEEIDASYESELDKHEPRLMLCGYCQKEYLIPVYLG